MPRLRRGDITLREIIRLSNDAYGKYVDNKKNRQVDITSAKISRRERLRYNFSTKQWEQVGSSVKFVFLITTDPVSYKRPKWDTGKHKYPIYLLLKDMSKGIDSPLRWRDGSFKKPRFGKSIPLGASKQQKEKIRKKNAEIQKGNIKNGIQMQAFFDTHWVQSQYGLLYGPNYANRSPKIKNPKEYPFFSKHMWYIINTIVLPFFRKEASVTIGKVFR
jgi:hypothetical protein